MVNDIGKGNLHRESAGNQDGRRGILDKRRSTRFRRHMATAVLSLDFHTSVRGNALREVAAQGLRENRLDPKSLYVTPRQADLWRAVSRAHSPIHGNPEFI